MAVTLHGDFLNEQTCSLVLQLCRYLGSGTGRLTTLYNLSPDLDLSASTEPYSGDSIPVHMIACGEPWLSKGIMYIGLFILNIFKIPS
jgi:hypothetical protein